jgi:replication fork protection complex subunit Tof1/Swi1
MGPAELELKKNKKLSWSQQMEVVIAVLLQAEHQAWIEWVISVRRFYLLSCNANCQVLEIALASREEVVIATDGIREPRDGEEEEMMERGARPMPSEEAMDKFVPFGMSASQLRLAR